METPEHQPPFVSWGAKLEELIKLAKKDQISEIELIKVINGLRLFPRGMEHQLSSLPDSKVDTLLKNWEVVIRQVARMRDAETGKTM